MKKIQPIVYGTIAALALSFLVTGCDRTVKSEKSTTVERDGTVKEKEKTVKESPDGSTTKEEQTRKTTPPANP